MDLDADDPIEVCTACYRHPDACTCEGFAAWFQRIEQDPIELPRVEKLIVRSAYEGAIPEEWRCRPWEWAYAQERGENMPRKSKDTSAMATAETDPAAKTIPEQDADEQGEDTETAPAEESKPEGGKACRRCGNPTVDGTCGTCGAVAG